LLPVRNINNWQRVPIKDVYLGLYDGPHATPKPAAEGPVFLGIKNITVNGRLNFSEIRHISEEDFPKWTNRVEPRPGDIVFTYEATLNRYAIIPEGFRGCLGRRMALIRPNPENVDTGFLFYYFFGNDWRATINQNILSGSTVDRVPLTTFPNFEISLPPLTVQREIASILSAYDDLIENNTRRIRILEEMAQSLYREWFVHSRFPGHDKVKLVNSPLGKIPERWEIVRVEELVNRIPSGKKYDSKTVTSEGLIPVLDQGRSGIIGFHDDAPGVFASGDSPVIVFANHTCYQRIIQFPFSAIQNVLPFIPSTQKYRDIYWLHWATKDIVAFNDYKGHWPEFIGKSILLPPTSLCRVFGGFVENIVKNVYKIEKISINLRHSRDLLLPKLISGDIEL